MQKRAKALAHMQQRPFNRLDAGTGRALGRRERFKPSQVFTDPEEKGCSAVRFEGRIGR